MANQTKAQWFGIIVLLSVFVGCSTSVPNDDVVPVSGTVQFDGAPPEGAFVSFVPSAKNTKAHMGSGIVDADGNFTVINSLGQSGLAAGEYIVTVSWRRGPDGGPPEKDEQGRMVGRNEMIPGPWNMITKAGQHNTVKVPEDGRSDFEFKIPKVMSDSDVIRVGGPNAGGPGGAKALGGPKGAGGPRAGN